MEGKFDQFMIQLTWLWGAKSVHEILDLVPLGSISCFCNQKQRSPCIWAPKHRLGQHQIKIYIPTCGCTDYAKLFTLGAVLTCVSSNFTGLKIKIDRMTATSYLRMRWSIKELNKCRWSYLEILFNYSVKDKSLCSLGRDRPEHNYYDKQTYILALQKTSIY